MATNTNDIDTQWNIPTKVSPIPVKKPVSKNKFDWHTTFMTAAGGASVMLVIKLAQFVL